MNSRILVVLFVVAVVMASCASDGTGTADGQQGGTAHSEGQQDAVGEGDVNDGRLPPAAGSSDTGDAATSGMAEPGDTPPPADDTDSLVPGDGIPEAVLLAMNDLAAMLGVPVDRIDWVSHVEVDWPDASVGCPLPDMAYAQVVTNGTLTVFEVDGIEYRYHSRAGMDPFYCDPSVMDKGASGSVDQIDLGEVTVPSTSGSTADTSKTTGSTPTESIPPISGSDE